MNHFPIGLWRATKSRFYTTSDNDHLSAWTKKKLQSTSQSQTCTKKRSCSLFGDLLPVWSTTAFWIPVKSLHLRSMLSKSMRCTENCNTCSRQWSTEGAQFFTTTPDCTFTQPVLQKLSKSWARRKSFKLLINACHGTKRCWGYRICSSSWCIITTFR